MNNAAGSLLHWVMTFITSRSLSYWRLYSIGGLIWFDGLHLTSKTFSNPASLNARLSGISAGGRLLMYDSGCTYMTCVRCTFVPAPVRVSI